MKRWYTVSYITDGRHQNVVEWEGFAEDSSDAEMQAMEDDYYYWKHVSTSYYERDESDVDIE
jgi:hypothetical protein